MKLMCLKILYFPIFHRKSFIFGKSNPMRVRIFLKTPNPMPGQNDCSIVGLANISASWDAVWTYPCCSVERTKRMNQQRFSFTVFLERLTAHLLRNNIEIFYHLSVERYSRSKLSIHPVYDNIVANTVIILHNFD